MIDPLFCQVDAPNALRTSVVRPPATPPAACGAGAAAKDAVLVLVLMLAFFPFGAMYMKVRSPIVKQSLSCNVCSAFDNACELSCAGNLSIRWG